MNSGLHLNVSEDRKVQKKHRYFSDYSILTSENIKNGYIQISQTKTGLPVTIPVHKAITKLLEKYHGTFPKPLTNQKTNQYLRRRWQGNSVSGENGCKKYYQRRS